jgi:hypothetical protein
MSGKRDSNSRPPAWEASALPTELLPQKDVQMYIFFVKVIPLFQDIFYEKVKVNLKLSLCKTSNSICYFFIKLSRASF